MTIEEMRNDLDKLCDQYRSCTDSCPLAVPGHKCGNGFSFLTEQGKKGYMSSEEICEAWLMAFGAAPTPVADEPHIRDSGSRTEFSTGAVRDIQKGKGRCDLMPLDVVAEFLGTVGEPDCVLMGIATFMGTGQIEHLHYALEMFRNMWGIPMETMLLEVSKHFEEGAEKYGEGNWQKGLPAKCYINSGVRHYLKYLRGDKDEFHDRAFCWNIICAIWTCKHRPELNDYAPGKLGFNPDDFIGEYEEEND